MHYLCNAFYHSEICKAETCILSLGDIGDWCISVPRYIFTLKLTTFSKQAIFPPPECCVEERLVLLILEPVICE